MFKSYWKIVLSSAFLIFQIGMIITSKFSDNRYFTWAPHDIQTKYKLRVYQNNLELTNDQLYTCFGLYKSGIEDLPPSHLIERLIEYMRLNPDHDLKCIEYSYSVNGKGWKVWTWKKEVCCE